MLLTWVRAILILLGFVAVMLVVLWVFDRICPLPQPLFDESATMESINASHREIGIPEIEWNAPGNTWSDYLKMKNGGW